MLMNVFVWKLRIISFPVTIIGVENWLRVKNITFKSHFQYQQKKTAPIGTVFFINYKLSDYKLFAELLFCHTFVACVTPFSISFGSNEQFFRFFGELFQQRSITYFTA